MKKNYISLISDTTFKYLFKSEKTRKWLEEIILEKTDINLKNYILVDNEDNTGSKVKDFRMDLLLKDNDNYVIIEMNKEYSISSINKARQYLYRKASYGFDKGESYKNPPKVKLIMFNNYLNKENKNIKTIKYSLYSKEYELEYKDIEIHEIYLKLFHEICYDKANKIDKRLWLFSCKNFEELNKVKEKDNSYIIEELERLSMNDKFVDEYDYENVQRKLLNSMKIEGYDEGFAEGINQEKIEIAKNMLKENIDSSVISKVTEIPVEKLENIDSLENINDEYDYENVQKKSLNSMKIEGYDEGYAEGINQRNIDIAKNMLEENIDFSVISKVTGLTKEEIKKLN